MAAQTEVVPSTTVDTYLRILTAEVNDLPYRLEIWDEELEDNQVTFYLEWDNYMGMLATLDRAYRAGEMAPPQRRAYRAVLRKLRTHLPIIQRLDLSHPPTALTP